MLLFYDNVMTGSIPPSLGNLTKLLEIRGHNNNVMGSLPSSFSNLISLTRITLNDNFLSGTLTPNLSELTAMSELDLSHNHLSGHFFEEFGQWESLRILQLFENIFSGPLPDILFPNLELMFFQSNQFTGSLNAMFNTNKSFPRLLNLDLSGKFQGTDLLLLCTFSSCVYHLYFKIDNKFSGKIPNGIFYSPSLVTIALSENCFTGHLPDSMCVATGTKVLALDGLSKSYHNNALLLGNV